MSTQRYHTMPSVTPLQPHPVPFAPSILSSTFFRLDLRAMESVKQGSNLTELFFKGRGIGIMDSGGGFCEVE